MAHLIAKTGMSKGKEYALQVGTILGRSDDADIVIEDRRASRQHAAINYSVHGPVIEDLGSRGGTYVNDEPVKSILLKNGDEIRICDAVFMVHIGRTDWISHSARI